MYKPGRKDAHICFTFLTTTMDFSSKKYLLIMIICEVLLFVCVYFCKLKSIMCGIGALKEDVKRSLKISFRLLPLHIEYIVNPGNKISQLYRYGLTYVSSSLYGIGKWVQTCDVYLHF